MKLSEYQLQYEAPVTVKLWYGRPTTSVGEQVITGFMVHSAQYLMFISKMAEKASKWLTKAQKEWL